MEKLKTISIKAMGLDPKTVANSDLKVPAAIIYGKVEGIKRKEQNGGVLTTFTGDFEGFNVWTGKTFNSETAFLPMGIDDYTEKQMAELGSPLKFAYVISIVKNAKSTLGYSYEAKPVHACVRYDAMAEHRSTLTETLRDDLLAWDQILTVPKPPTEPPAPPATTEPPAPTTEAPKRRNK